MQVATTDFEDLYRQWYGPVVNVCRRVLGTCEDAETIAQDAFVRAWRSWDRFSPDRPFGPWVVTIARRLCINESRAASRRSRLVETTDEGMDPGLVDRTIERHTVQYALRRLSPRYRRVLCLRDVEGWSYEQIASIDDSTVEAVRGALKRARAEFRRVYTATVAA